MIRLLPLLLTACVWSTSHEAPVASGPAQAARTLDQGGSVKAVDRHGLRAHMTARSEHTRVYNLWATWCAPCIAEMPELEAFADEHPDVDLWLVNTDHPKVAARKLDRFIAEHGLSDRQHLRPTPGESDITAAIPEVPAVLPTTYVVAPSGTVTHTFPGRIDPEQLARAVQ